MELEIYVPVSCSEPGCKDAAVWVNEREWMD